MRKYKNRRKEEEPDKALRKRLKKRRTFLVAIGIALCLAVVIIIFFRQDRGKITVPEDLIFSDVDVPKEDNAYYVFEKAEDELNISEEERELISSMQSDDEWDDDLIGEIIERNKRVFQLFDKALEKRYFHPPDFRISEMPELDKDYDYAAEYRNYLNADRLIIIKADYLFRQGKTEDFLELIMKSIKMGNIAQNSPKLYFHNFFGIQLRKNLGIGRIQKIISESDPLPDGIEEHVSKLEDLSGKEGYKKAQKIEFMRFVQYIYDTLSSNHGLYDRILGNTVQWKEIINSIMKALKIVINNLDDLSYAELKDKLPEKKEDIRNAESRIELLKSVLIDKAAYKFLYNEYIEYGLFLEITYMEDFVNRATRVLLALRKYHIDEGKLPESLDRLVPDYLSEIPEDPFDNEKIRYCRDKEIIYTVGRALEDLGGDEEVGISDLYEKDNPSVGINF